MPDPQSREDAEKRISPRKLYSGNIFFATGNGFYEGKLKNYCRYGLFIETRVALEVGEIITIALPFLDVKIGKFKGQILWRNKKGFGVELFKKRNPAFANLKLIP